MTTTTQQENISRLLKLVEENPNLRIMPMVDSDIIAGDDYSWWLGSWGKAEVEEVYSDDERIYIRSEDEDSLIENVETNFDFNPDLSDTEIHELCREEVKGYEWERVIAVKIQTP